MTQLTEEQQGRLEQIREGGRTANAPELADVLAIKDGDIDFLLSLLSQLDSDSQAARDDNEHMLPCLMADCENTRGHFCFRHAVEVNAEADFNKWWARNHPHDWWASERKGKPLPDSDRLRVFYLVQEAFCTALAASENTATAMRDTVKSLRLTPRGAAYNNAINDAIHKIESLTLEPEKQK